MSFLGLEGYHAFITGAAGDISSQGVRGFLSKSIQSITKALSMLREVHLTLRTLQL